MPIILATYVPYYTVAELLIFFLFYSFAAAFLLSTSIFFFPLFSLPPACLLILPFAHLQLAGQIQRKGII